MNIDENDVVLSLGDIIHITTYGNSDINNKMFFIDYISNDHITFKNKTDKYDFNIVSGNIEDADIQEIKILSKATSPSYAIQHNLLPSSWISIHTIYDDIENIYTGQIINLENDMIEVNL